MPAKKSELKIESKSAKWISLLLISATMFSGYFFVEMISPLKPLLESHYHWDAFSFQLFSYSKFFLIVLGFLLLAGLLLDRFGIRIIGFIATVLMLSGASLLIYGFSPAFNDGGNGFALIKSIFPQFQPSLIIAIIGYSIFGLGVEIIGITGIRAVVKWFKGKELGYSIGILIAFSRLGAAFAFMLSANFAGFREVFGLPHGKLLNPVYFGNSLLFIGFLTFLTFALIDKNFDSQIEVEKKTKSDIKFNFSNLLLIFRNKTTLYLSLIFVIMYSFSSLFASYFVNQSPESTGMLKDNSLYFYGIIFLGTILFSPISGRFYDKNFKVGNLFMISAVLIILAFLLFLFFSSVFTITTIGICLVVLSFTITTTTILSHYSAIIPEEKLGYAYASLFWLQSIGLIIFSLIF
jgi:MFS family permease